MVIKTPKNFSIGSITGEELEDVIRYIRELDTQLRYLTQRVYTDFVQGNTRLELLDEYPDPDDLDEGQRVLVEDGDDYFLCVKIEDSLYRVTLAEVP